MITDFNIATDLKVELYLPAESDYFVLGFSALGGVDVLVDETGVFVLGTSLLGSTDVLGDSTNTAFAWTAVEAETASFRSNLGGTIENSVYFQPEAAGCNLVMQSWTYDPSVNPFVRPGAKVRVRLDDGSVNQVLFTGYIDTIDVDYAPDEPNRISINATDKYKRIINQRVPIYDTDDYEYITPLESLELVMQQLGYVMSSQSVATDGKIPGSLKIQEIASGIINEALQVGLGMTWLDQELEQLIFMPRPATPEGTATTYVIGNNHPVAPATDPYHLCMSGIVVAADQDNVYNSLKVSLVSDANTFVILKDQDTIDLYGESSIDISLNVVDETELTRWANQVFNSSSVKLVKSVTTPAIDRLGNLTQAAFFTPGTVVGVKYAENQLDIDAFYTITKVNHSVDVNSWYTTLELWKEV